MVNYFLANLLWSYGKCRNSWSTHKKTGLLYVRRTLYSILYAAMPCKCKEKKDAKNKKTWSHLSLDMIIEVLHAHAISRLSKLSDALLHAPFEESTCSSNKFVREVRSTVDFLCSMPCVNRACRRAFDICSPSSCATVYWEKMLHLLVDSGRKGVSTLEGGSYAQKFLREDSSVQQKRHAVLLITRTGCQLCHKPRIRKVHWEMMDGQGVRCCQECLEARTVSDYRLKEDYAVWRASSVRESSIDTFLSSMPHNVTQMYHPNIGSYELRFYWIPSVLVRLGLCADSETAHKLSPEEARELLGTFRRDIEREREDAMLAQKRLHEEKVGALFERFVREMGSSEDAAIHRAVTHMRCLEGGGSFPAGITVKSLAANSPTFQKLISHPPQFIEKEGEEEQLVLKVRKVLKETLHDAIHACLTLQAFAYLVEAKSCTSGPLYPVVKAAMRTEADRLCNTILRKTKGLREERHPVWESQWFRDNVEPILERDIQRHEEEQRKKQEQLVQRAHEEKARREREAEQRNKNREQWKRQRQNDAAKREHYIQRLQITCPVCVEMHIGNVGVRYFPSVEAMTQHCQAKHNCSPP